MMAVSASSPEVCAIVLGYGCVTDTVECIYSLLNQQGVILTVIVVDNGGEVLSKTTDTEVLKLCRYEWNGANVGAAAGRNLGIKIALAEFNPRYLFFADNDALFEEDAIVQSIHCVNSNNDAGFVGSVFYRKYEREVVFSAGAKISSGLSDYHIVDVASMPAYYTVDYIGSGGMLVRKELVEEIGAMDESFFYGDEDTEWCLRGAKAGWRTYICKYSRAYHDIPRNKLRPHFVYLRARNRFIVFNRYGYVKSLFSREVLFKVHTDIRKILRLRNGYMCGCLMAYLWAYVHALAEIGGQGPKIVRENWSFGERALLTAIVSFKNWILSISHK